MTARKSTQDITAKDPSKTLTLAYVTAFAIIAILTIASHTLTTHITHKQTESAEISYKLGKQRSHVQQIAHFSDSYYKTGEDFDFDLLAQAINNMEVSHGQIKQAIAQMEVGNKSMFSGLERFVNSLFGKNETIHHNPSSKHSALHTVYYETPFFLNADIEAFIKEAKKFRDFTKHKSKSSERSATRKHISKEFTIFLVPSLDAALESYQSETIHKITSYYNMQLFSVYSILIVLLLEAGFIFRPLVARIHEYHKRLLRIAHEDPLTGLDNRRAFTLKSNEAFRNAHMHGSTLAVALTDLDKFKLVNDTYGHDVGDKVLQHFAEILRSTVRSEDIVGRIGGEEFALILPNCDAEVASQVLERIRQTTEMSPCPYKDDDGRPAKLPYTLSIGFVLLKPIPSDTLDELLKIADAGLYKAKEEGRNRIISMPAPKRAVEKSDQKKKKRASDKK